MTRFEAITPIHIGTGEMVEPICYQVRNHMARRYSLADVVSGIPAERLCNPQLLNRLTRSNSKMDYYKIFKTDRIHGEPLYELKWNIDMDVHQEEIHNNSGGSQVIFEQIKSLGKPIVPGSSLKGAIECAFKYTLLKDNLNRVRRNHDSYLDNVRKSTAEHFYLNLIYGLSEQEIRSQKYSDFLHELYSILEVPDLIFDDLEVLYVDRFNIDPSKASVPLGAAECIPVGAVGDASELFSINLDKLRILKAKYQDAVSTQLIDSFCNKENLIRSIQIYMSDMSRSDSAKEYEDLYEDEGAVGDCAMQIQKVRTEIRKASENKDMVVIRIGKYTSYFYKTVSWLFKTEFASDFKYDFYKVFSPAPAGKKNSPKPDTMPRSVPLLTDDDSTWPAGYLKVYL